MLLIKNTRYLGKRRDVLIRDGKIHAFGEKLAVLKDCEVVYAQGQVLFPGLIDAHVHFRDPGAEWKEDIATGLEAAAHGGFSHVMCMANTDPVNDEASVTRYMLEKAAATHPDGPFLHPIAAATVGLKGEQLAPVGELAEAGCIAVSNDGRPIANTDMMRRVMEYASDLGLRVIDHCEDPWLAKGTHMNEGKLSARMGVKGQPSIAEAIQAARDALLAEYLGVPVHLAHISCRASLNVIREAKARGVMITAETAPHYLLLDESAVEGYDTNAKMNPPLREKEDVLAMREAVKSGLIDIIATDHAPHAAHEKEHPFDLVPNGITGLDTALPLLWGLVDEGVFTQQDIIRAYSERPAELFGLPHNSFKTGDPADLFLFNPREEWVVSKETLFSKSANSPWLGQKLRGRVTAAWIGGKKLF